NAAPATPAGAGRENLIAGHFYSVPGNPDVPLEGNADAFHTQRDGGYVVVQKPADVQTLTRDFVKKQRGAWMSGPRGVAGDGKLAKILLGEEAPGIPEKNGEKEKPFVGYSLSITPQTTPEGLQLVVSSAVSTATDATTNQPVNAPIADWSRVVTHTRKMSA